MRWQLLVVLSACGGEQLVCGEGTVQTEDRCEVVDEAPPGLSDVLDQIAPCEPLEPDGRLNLEDGCVDGGCAGMTPSELIEAWGEGDCYALFDGYLHCDWSLGVSLFLADTDRDGQPDEEEQWSLDVDARFDGTTNQGTGIEAGFGCWLDEMGKPTEVSFERMGAAYVLSRLYWDPVWVSDRDGGGKDGYQPDGQIDSITLWPPSGIEI